MYLRHLNQRLLFGADMVMSEFLRKKMDSFLLRECEKYLEDISIYRVPSEEKKLMINEAGLCMRAFIAWVKNSDVTAILESTKSYATLKTVFMQNFEDNGPDDDPPELIKIATGKGHIYSPHEPEARYANKGGQGWVGYKAQIAETVSEPDSDNCNFITFADVADATDHDGSVIAAYHADLEQKELTPSEVYADTHYNTEKNIESLAVKGTELKGPVIPMPEQDRTKEGNRGFIVDISGERVTCPVGNESIRFSHRAQNKVSATLSSNNCHNCYRKSRCQPAPRGKNILIKVESPILTARRQEMTTPEFQLKMHKRNGIEGTLSGLVRGQGMRRSRYRGKSKLQLQIKHPAVAANVKRLHNHRLNTMAA